MNTPDLAAALAARTGLTRTDRFGVFEARHRAARPDATRAPARRPSQNAGSQ